MKYLIVATGLGLGAWAAGALAQPAPPLTADEQKIVDIAAASSCREGDKSSGTGSWNEDPKDKDRAPLGYIKGIALVYAKSFCESRGTAKSAVEVMQKPVGVPAQDALAWYQLSGATAAERVRAIFTLGLGVGMRESTGNTTDGRDKKNKKSGTAKTAEAGLYQTSFNSLKNDPWLEKLYGQYRANPTRCRLAVFLEGVKDLQRTPVGTGPGAEFQKFTKECPAFATEYAMVMFRVRRTHYGTINNNHAKYVQACNAMFKEIEAVVKCSP